MEKFAICYEGVLMKFVLLIFGCIFSGIYYCMMAFSGRMLVFKGVLTKNIGAFIKNDGIFKKNIGLCR